MLPAKCAPYHGSRGSHFKGPGINKFLEFNDMFNGAYTHEASRRRIRKKMQTNFRCNTESNLVTITFVNYILQAI